MPRSADRLNTLTIMAVAARYERWHAVVSLPPPPLIGLDDMRVNLSLPDESRVRGGGGRPRAKQ